jgi:hypothetical protein
VPKGLDFVRGAIAAALRPKDYAGAVMFAESRWGERSRAALVAKAAVVGLNTQTDGGDQMVGDEGAAAEFFSLVRSQSIISRLPGLRFLPFNVSTLSIRASRHRGTRWFMGRLPVITKGPVVCSCSRLKASAWLVACNRRE